MGLLDRFRKEEHTHFERNDNGRVTHVYHNGEEGKSSDQLLHEYKEKNPGKLRVFASNIKREYTEHSQDRMITHAKEKEAFKEGFERGRVKRAGERGFARGFGPMPIQQPKIVYVHQQKHKQGKKHKQRQQHRQREPQFDMMTGRWR
jgi:hypothetical protein